MTLQMFCFRFYVGRHLEWHVTSDPELVLLLKLFTRRFSFHGRLTLCLYIQQSVETKDVNLKASLENWYK